MAETTNVMEPASMKMLLIKSKEEPVNAAIGLGADGGAKLLLHKTKSAMAVGKDLEKDSQGLKNMRFGTAHVDVDDDPKLVKLTINRAVSGMARRLKLTLKGTGFTKVMIVLDDGTVLDQVGEEEEEGEAPPSSSAPPPPPVDAALLTMRLTALVGGVRTVIQSAPGSKDALMALATAAQTAIKSGNLVEAQAALARLQEALTAQAQAPATAEASAPVAAKAAATGAVTFMKMRLLWDATRKNLTEQLKKLEAAIVEEAADEPDAAEIAANVNRIEAKVALLDGSLSDALDNLYNAGGTDRALKQTARDIALSFQAFIATSPLLQELDDNPFVPLDARARLEATLASMITHL